MIDLYLKATVLIAMRNAIPFAVGLDDSGKKVWLVATHDYSLDIIGALYNDDGVYDDEGNVIAEPTLLNGFHANIRCTQEIADLIPSKIIITPPPSKLKRVWA